MTTTDLIVFLGARLDEREAAAMDASPGPWHLNAEGDEVMAVDNVTAAEAFALSGSQQRATAAHIVLHDPARALREVEADRKLIDLYGRSKSYRDRVFARPEPRSVSDEMRAVTQMLALEQVLKLRAAAYSDHPDYDTAWSPTAAPAQAPRDPT